MRFKLKTLNDLPQAWELNDYLSVGSDSTCQICLSGFKLDARHCRLETKGKHLYIKDLRSSTGTFVNGAKVLDAELSDADVITVGDLDLVVIDTHNTLTEFPLTSKQELWSQQLSLLNRVAKSNHSILLLGESGTGKDVIAKKIHAQSERCNHIFMSVNCSALTETLVESELFGHIKGSFTGAVSDRKGAFEAARGGTLFLDEIGDLPYSLQAKILRALENEEIRPVGSDRIIKTNVRIIAATHKNLLDKVQEGVFRQDLYYRLNVITVEVPNLKDRIEDFEDLIYQFAKEFRVRFSHLAIAKLKRLPWHGNIRELKNFVIKCSTLYPKEFITEQIVDFLFQKKEYSITSQYADQQTSNSAAQKSVIKEIERQMILRRLKANKGSQKLTARDLGMPKSTLHDRIKTYKIDVHSL